MVATLALMAVASAADMPIRAASPFPVAAPYNWTGFYVGATAGYVLGSSQHCDTVPFCTPSFNVDGFTGGGTLGYNRQMGNWVAGVEADFSGSLARGTTSSTASFGCGLPATCYTDLDWYGTVRGRIGPAYDNWFPYVTGGFAYGELKAGLGTSVPPAGLSASSVEPGWMLGSGVEYAFMNRWSIKLEYLYFQLNDVFYDTAHLCNAQSCTAMHNNFNVVRLGVNYRF
jgi:outer membrane immunogenic protein